MSYANYGSTFWRNGASYNQVTWQRRLACHCDATRNEFGLLFVNRIRIPMALCVSAMAAAAVSCRGTLTYMDVFVAGGPDGRREVRVSERACFADCVVRVSVISEHGRRDLAIKDDGYADFVEAVWSPDSRTVATFVHLLFRPGVVTGYDFVKEVVIPAEIARAQVEAAIRVRYSLPPGFLVPYEGSLDRWAEEVGRYKFDLSRVIQSKRPISLPYMRIEANAMPQFAR